MEKHIQLPLTEELAKTLHAGDTVYLSGTIYTSRDAGHKRMCEALARGEKIPFDPTDATIYYVGPTPAKPWRILRSHRRSRRTACKMHQKSRADRIRRSRRRGTSPSGSRRHAAFCYHRLRRK